MNEFKKILMTVALSCMAFNVMAIPSSYVTGQLEMTGSFYAIAANGLQTTDASAAVAIDFNYWGADQFIVTNSDGSFSGLTNQKGNISDFQFDNYGTPIAGYSLANASIADFWDIAGFSFELTNIVRDIGGNATTDLLLSGTGILTHIDYIDTGATWSFSGDTSGNGVFSWSATSESAVPEPGILALLSLGLIGIGLRKKDIKQNLK